MEVTLLGIIILVRLLQPENALPPMEVTLLGIVTLVRLLQSENALSPMEVTPSGHSYAPILPTGYATRVFMPLLNKTPSTEHQYLLSGSTLMFSNLLQPLKINEPMEVTLFGIVTLVRLLQRSNAKSLMEVTLLGIVTLVRLLQL